MGWFNWRMTALILTSLAAPAACWLIWFGSDAPKWVVAFSGVLFLCAAAAWFAIGLLLWIAAEELRPSIRLRKPASPISITHREASFVGQRRYRHHPVRFWGVFTLNHSFVFGFMLCAEPEYETLREPTTTPESEG